MAQVNPPIHVVTPLGDAFCYFLEDGPRGVEWQTFIARTGESWWWRNHHVRQVDNITTKCGPHSPFTDITPELQEHIDRYVANGWLRGGTPFRGDDEVSAPGGNGASIAGDWDPDDEDGYEPEERTPAPDFGCACQDALVVDTVCPACIAYLAEQDRAARSPGGSTAPGGGR